MIGRSEIVHIDSSASAVAVILFNHAITARSRVKELMSPRSAIQSIIEVDRVHGMGWWDEMR